MECDTREIYNIYIYEFIFFNIALRAIRIIKLMTKISGNIDKSRTFWKSWNVWFKKKIKICKIINKMENLEILKIYIISKFLKIWDKYFWYQKFEKYVQFSIFNFFFVFRFSILPSDYQIPFKFPVFIFIFYLYPWILILFHFVFIWKVVSLNYASCRTIPVNKYYALLFLYWFWPGIRPVFAERYTHTYISQKMSY